jgi:hypothetical protein
MSENFAPDPKIQQIAEAYAQDAVDFAGQHFKIVLDWTDASVAKVETILDVFHQQALRDKPTEEQVLQLGKMFGSYVGEVYRRNHGATWGMVTINGESFPGLNALNSDGLFWPWGRANNRIANGFEDNIWHYYQFLVQKYDPNNSQPSSWDNKPPEKKPWWKKLWGI